MKDSGVIGLGLFQVVVRRGKGKEDKRKKIHYE